MTSEAPFTLRTAQYVDAWHCRC